MDFNQAMRMASEWFDASESKLSPEEFSGTLELLHAFSTATEDMQVAHIEYNSKHGDTMATGCAHMLSALRVGSDSRLVIGEIGTSSIADMCTMITYLVQHVAAAIQEETRRVVREETEDGIADSNMTYSRELQDMSVVMPVIAVRANLMLRRAQGVDLPPVEVLARIVSASAMACGADPKDAWIAFSCIVNSDKAYADAHQSEQSDAFAEEFEKMEIDIPKEDDDE